MITIKNKSSIRKMEEAGIKLSGLFDDLASVVKAGSTTLFLNEWIEQQLRTRGLVSRMKGYMGYPHASCISVNDGYFVFTNSSRLRACTMLRG